MSAIIKDAARETLPEKRELSSAGRAELDALLPRYPTKRAALLPALRIAEKQFGCVDHGAMRAVAEALELTPAYVQAVFTFYTHFRRPTDGKYVVEVCRTLPCALRGADTFAGYVSRKLGIRPGETTKDGKFSLKDAECMAACDIAPVCQVNALYHGNLTPELFDKLLESLP
ncbi:NAD(P)H-dependent oxidoreductase subunit E [bacterium]|nr:NAD(P)H-dependent oxidoreductase subunit E [bacterium]